MKHYIEFPRDLTVEEKQYLFSVLPEFKIGYSVYLDRINLLSVISRGRFSDSNLILGLKQDSPDLSIPSSPILALGKIEYKSASLDITIHEEQFNQIEIDLYFRPQEISIQNLIEIKRWNYSDWNPGDNNPEDNSNILQFNFKNNSYVLAIALTTKKIWLHDSSNGVNHLIPLTNFYNELMAVKKIRDPKIALRPEKFFHEINHYSREELGTALISYNNYLKRLNLNLKTEDLYLPDNQKSKQHFFFRRK